MRAFRLQNFRGFEDTGWIELKPLSLLVGPNSTGKSSVLRFLPLLRQSVGAPTRGPFLWNKEGGLDLGTFEDVLRRRCTEPLQVSMRIGPGPWGRAPSTDGADGLKSGPERELVVGLDRSNGGGASRASLGVDRMRFSGSATGAGGALRWQGRGKGLAYELHFTRGPVPAVERGPAPGALVDEAWSDEIGLALKAIGLAPSRSEIEVLALELRGIYQFNGGAGHQELLRIVARMLQSRWGVGPLTAAGADFEPLLTIAFHMAVPDLMRDVDWALREWAERIAYLGPARENPLRYYRNWEDPATRLDPTGRNLPLVLRALPPEGLARFNVLLRERLGYEVLVEGEGASIQVQLTDAAGERFNIVDLGFGFSQVLPIYVQSFLGSPAGRSSRQRPSVVAIEQPELHLHPRHQARLADLFAGIIADQGGEGAEPSAPLFVETHSECLIDRLGELISEGKVRREDVQVFLFEKKGADCTMRTTAYDEEGVLIDWPPGFLSR